MSLIYTFAASTESQAVKGLMNPDRKDTLGLVSGRIGTNDVVLFVTGIGPKAARSSATSALLTSSPSANTPPASCRPDAVFVIGTCGSLNSSIGEGDIIVYSECLTSDTNTVRAYCTTPLAEHLSRLLRAKRIASRKAVGVSTPRIATTKEEKLKLAKLGAEVVDMESYEIIAAANQVRLPVAVIRVVSDSLDRQIPDFNPALRDNGKLDSLKLLTVAVGSPILTAKVLAASRRALEKLKSALRVVLSDETYSNLKPEASTPQPSLNSKE